MGQHEGLQACVYKGVKVEMVNGNAKSFFYVREKKGLETLNQMKQIVTLNKKCNKKQS